MTDVKLSSMIKKVLTRKFETGDDYYRFRISEVPHEHCDGFWPSTNGGQTVERYTMLSSFEGSGRRFGIKDVDAHIDTLLDSCHEEADRLFVEDHPEYEGKDFDYNSLYDEGKGGLAEELENTLRREQDDILVEMVMSVRIYLAGQKHDKSCLGDRTHIVILGWIEVNGKTYYVVDKTITDPKMFRRKISKYATKLNKLFEAGEE